MNQQRTAPGQRAIVPVDRTEQELNPTTVLEQVLLAGDLASLTPAERLTYYHNLCESLGLNPFTRPFEYLTLKGKLVLYAKKDATEQLRKIHGVSIEKVELSYADGLVDAIVTARDKTGRTDVDLGSVHIGAAKGEELANAKLKAVTKGKRRVTLSICGLGLLDETEVASIPDAKAVLVDEQGAIVEPSAPKNLGDYERSRQELAASTKPQRATTIEPPSPQVKELWDKIKAGLQADHNRVEAESKLPKPIAQQTVEELEKTLAWLEKRARNYAQYQADQAQQSAIEGEIVAPASTPPSDPREDHRIVTEQARRAVTEIRTQRPGGPHAGDYATLRALLAEYQRCAPIEGEMPAKDVPAADLLELVSARSSEVIDGAELAGSDDEEGEAF